MVILLQHVKRRLTRTAQPEVSLFAVGSRTHQEPEVSLFAAGSRTYQEPEVSLFADGSRTHQEPN